MLLQEIFRLKYLLLAQIIVLGISAYLDFLPFYVFIGVVLLLLVSIKSFNEPYFAIIILMIAMIIDALIPFKFKSTGPSLLVTEFFLLVFIPIVFIKFLYDYKNIKFESLLWIWLPFLFWSLLIGLVIGVDKFKVISFWKNFFAGYFVFATVLLSVNNSKQLINIFRAIILWGATLALLEIKVIIEAGGLAAGIVGLFLYKNLLSVGWGKSNYLAAFFVIIIPITIGYLIYTKKKISKYLLTISLLLMFFAVTLTLSRGGILALLITLLILLPKVLNRKYFFPFIVIFLSVSLIIFLNPLTYVIIDRIATLESSSSVYSRINFYKDVWNTFLTHPITGVGLGNLGYYSKFILGPELSPSAHNIILGALGELGIIGTLFYLSIFILLTIKIYQGYKFEKDESLKTIKWCLFSSVVGALIHTLVEPTLEGLQFSIIFWTISGLNFKVNLLFETADKID
jgi:O-antigen ligase